MNPPDASILNPLEHPDLQPGAIAGVAERIAPHVRRTPVIDLHLEGHAIQLKLEHLQVSGTFKARGAFNTLLGRPAAEVVAASGGNHGIAVAHAARELGVRAHVFVPETAPAAKQDRLRALGAQVHARGQEYVEAFRAAQAFAQARQAPMSHAYDQLETLAGQGTLGLEWLAQSPQLDTLLIAVGGGGLIGGVAAATRGRVRLVAVETLGCPTLHRALAAGHPVDVEVGGLAADALGARRVGDWMFPLARRWVSDAVLVDDEATRSAQRQLWAELRLAVEPAAATVWAALRSGAYRPQPGERVGLLMCGGNVDPRTLVQESP